MNLAKEKQSNELAKLELIKHESAIQEQMKLLERSQSELDSRNRAIQPILKSTAYDKVRNLCYNL